MRNAPTVKRQRKSVVQPHAMLTEGLGRAVAYYFTGCKYDTVLSIAIAAVSGELYAYPIHIPAGTRFDGFGIYFGLNAGELSDPTSRIGIYNTNHDTGGPGDLVVELGTLAEVSSAFTSDTSIDFTIWETGLYWVGMLTEATTNYNGQRGMGMMPVNNANVHTSAAYKWTGVSTGSMPDPAPSGPTAVATVPSTLLRVKETPSQVMPLKRAHSLCRALPMEDEWMTEGCEFTRVDPDPGLAMAQNDLVLAPVPIATNAYITQLSVSVTVAAVGGNGTIVVYDSRPDNYPGRLMAAVTVDFSGTGVKTAAVNWTLGPGLYWMGVHNTAGGAATLTGVRAPGHSMFAITGSNYPVGGITANSAPTPDPYNLSPSDELTPPRVRFAVNSALSDTMPHASHVRRLPAVWGNIFHGGWWVGPLAGLWTESGNKAVAPVTAALVPLWVDMPMTFDAIGVDCLNATGADTLETGIYHDNGYGCPGRLIRRLPNIVTDSAAIFTAAFAPLRLDPGLYWVGYRHASGVNNEYAQQTAFSSLAGCGNPAAQALGGFMWISAGDFTDPYVGTGTTIEGPAIFLQVATHG